MRKFVLVFTSMLLIFLTFNVQKPQAVAGAAVRIVGGEVAEKVLLGVAEKSAIKYAQKSAQRKALERWNYTLDDWYQIEDAAFRARIYKFEQEVLQAKPVPIPEKPGYSRVVISAAAFLTGADLIYEAYKAFDTAYDNSKFVEGMTNAVESGKGYFTLGNFHFTEYVEDYGEFQVGRVSFRDGAEYTSDVQYGYGYPLDTTPSYYMEIGSRTATTMQIITHVRNVWYEDGELYNQTRTHTFGITELPDMPNITAIDPLIQEVPDVSKIPSVMQPWLNPTTEAAPGTPDPKTDPGLDPEGDGIEIIIPSTEPWPDPYTDPTPINEPISEPVSDPVSDPADDGTGTNEPPTPPTDGTPTNPFQKLIPTAILLAFLDLFRAIIEYLIRMFKFVLSIPLVPSKPIDNEAFVWFRSAKIVGVQIYEVVSGLATIGLSFAVYKSVRRFLP